MITPCMKNHKNAPSRSAFTLIEMLIVLAIIFLLISMGMNGYHRVRQYAQHATCMSNLKTLGYSMNLYLSEYNAIMMPTQNAAGDRWSTILVENEYLHEGREFEPAHLDSGSAREVGTEPLLCPNDYSDLNMFFKDKFAYGGSYAINKDISSTSTSQRYWSHLKNAHTKIVLTDYNHEGIQNTSNYMISAGGNSNNWETGGTANTGTVGEIHFGGANCLFADWHVESRTHAELSDENFSLEMDFN